MQDLNRQYLNNEYSKEVEIELGKEKGLKEDEESGQKVNLKRASSLKNKVHAEK